MRVQAHCKNVETITIITPQSIITIFTIALTMNNITDATLVNIILSPFPINVTIDPSFLQVSNYRKLNSKISFAHGLTFTA